MEALGLASLFGSLFSTGVSSVSAYYEAQAANYSKQWNAEQARIGAEIASAKADIYRKLGDTEKFEVMQQYDAIRSAQRSEYGAAGVNVNVGSAIEMQAQTAMMGVYEGQKAEYQRDLQAWEMDVEARNLNLTAEMNLASMNNPWISAVTAGVSGLTGSLGVYSSWQKQSGSTSSKISESSSYTTNWWV